MTPTDDRPPRVTQNVPSAADLRALAADLARRLKGEVRFDRGSRALYSTDASNYRQVPLGVVLPRDVDDVVATVEACRRWDAPIVPRGGGTSLAGQATNVAVVIDMSKYMHHVLSIDPERRLARVEPGCNLDVLRDAAAEHGLTFGPDPATHNRNTLGGMLGNNSCGVHSVLSQFYGPGPLTADNVESMEVLTYEGDRFEVGATSDEDLERIRAGGGRPAEIYRALEEIRDEYAQLVRRRLPDIPRRVSGYNLDRLLPERGFQVAQALVGTEGTCVVVLEATLRLIPSRPARTLVALGFQDVYRAADAVPDLMARRPVGLEGFDEKLVHFLKLKGLHPDEVSLLPEGEGWLLVEFGADEKVDADAQAEALVRDIEDRPSAPSARVFSDPAEAKRLWTVRESALGATAHVPGNKPVHPGWEDAAVPPAVVGRYLREFRALLDRYGYDASLYGHFGQGCIHCHIDFDLGTVEGLRTWRAFLDEAADLVVAHGGSLSGEHGDGQARAGLLARMVGEDLVEAFRRFKYAWDPRGRMNPGKVVDAYRPDENLRLGPDYAPRSSRTFFAYPQDEGVFAKAVERCVGVGLCRRTSGGVMCPSYMATREEEHSTRGRARLLFEMMRGETLPRGWKSDAVKEALDLCLACKGCLGECPVHVDMATYKAELLAHYYRARPRPRAAYLFGWFPWWARLASKAPRLVNALSGFGPLGALWKRVGGIAPERPIPRFAEETFAAWFQRRTPRRGGRRVLFWPDTFSNHLRPAPARAAVEVLEAAGYDVTIPPKPLCCGRPLYDYGFLGLARKLWRETVRTLRAEIRAGVPVVGVEPSCIAAFRDELPKMLPGDEDARRLAAQTKILSELLVEDGWTPPRLSGKAIVHGHCHHKAVLRFEDEKKLLDQLGLDYRLLDSGCCGMAGPFGYTRAHFDVSTRCADRVLVPAVLQAGADTRIVTDGYSCREQIEQLTGRHALHMAELLREAL